MYCGTALSILTSGVVLLTSAAALPTAADLVPRACVTEYPSFLTSIQEASPDTAFGNTQFTIVTQNPRTGNEIDTLIKFTDIPTNAYGCQLEFFAPPGFDVRDFEGSTLLNVWATTREVLPTDTWANAPGKSYLFGSVTLRSQESEATTIVVNSLPCQPSLSFRVDIASETAFGQVLAAQVNPPRSPAGGWRITRNC